MKRIVCNLLTWAVFILCVWGLIKMGPETLAAEAPMVPFADSERLSEPVWGEVKGTDNLLWVSFGAELPTVSVEKEEARLLAKLVWGEARGVKSKAERAAVIWCALNRVDSTGYACGKSVKHVVTYPSQFTGYRKGNPVTKECYDLAVDVLARWKLEKLTEGYVGRVLPEDYLWFRGHGGRNHFRNAYVTSHRWDWSLEGPYDEIL